MVEWGRLNPHAEALMPPPLRSPLRADLRDFLADEPSPVMASVRALADRWDQYRAASGLPQAASGERAFRQLLHRAEQAGEIRLLRTADGAIAGAELANPPAGSAERMRRLRTERLHLARRYAPAEPGIERDLPQLPTPALNAYVRRRRVYEQARRDFERNGIDPDGIADIREPLGEEALALKERVVRLEGELLAWRRLGGSKGITPSPEQMERALRGA